MRKAQKQQENILQTDFWVDPKDIKIVRASTALGEFVYGDYYENLDNIPKNANEVVIQSLTEKGIAEFAFVKGDKFVLVRDFKRKRVRDISELVSPAIRKINYKYNQYAYQALRTNTEFYYQDIDTGIDAEDMEYGISFSRLEKLNDAFIYAQLRCFLSDYKTLQLAKENRPKIEKARAQYLQILESEK